MLNKTINKSLIILIMVFVLSCSSESVIKNTTSERPHAEREFRAAWVATVANINWPSKNNLTPDEQKKEAIDILNFLKDHNFNAVIFQARPQCDAMYLSEIEPWSYYLTGKQGKAPDPFYDPLEFWTEESHKRGLELHVWLNPYRAHHTQGGEISEKSIVNKKPGISLNLKSGYYWLDPGLKETQDHSYSVVMDILKRYDVDGIHFDDYFYPYPSYNNDEDFPDSVSWGEYQKAGGLLTKDDWRRDNVNKFVKRIYEGIKTTKPSVKFGLSPFGIWRPNHPQSIKGFDQYKSLYADAKLWLNEGWIDYWAPQLYWSINDIEQSYPVLLGWWQSQNLKNKHFWPGISIDKGSNEIVNQIMITRGMLPENPGNIHWSVGQLQRDKELQKDLISGPYKNQALIPFCNWMKTEKPQIPEINYKFEENVLLLSLAQMDKNTQSKWIIYYRYGNNWHYKIIPFSLKQFYIPLKNNSVSADMNGELLQVFVTVVNKCGIESDLKEIPLVKL